MDDRERRRARPPVKGEESATSRGVMDMMRESFAMPFRKSQRWMRMIGGGLLVMSIVVLAVSVLTYTHTRRFVDSALRAPGKVVEMVAHRESTARMRPIVPVFVFRDANQREHKIRSSVGTSPPSYDVGDDVTVLYRPEEPEKASLDGFFDLWLFPLGVGLHRCGSDSHRCDIPDGCRKDGMPPTAGDGGVRADRRNPLFQMPRSDTTIGEGNL